MADFTAGFETGVNGNTVSAADAGDATAFGAGTPALVGGATATYDNAHVKSGSLAMKFVNGSSGSSYVYWSASQVDHYGRFYLYLPSNPGGSNPIFQCDTTRQARIDITAAGKIRIIDAPATGDVTGSVSVALNQFIRIEYHIIHSATVGFIEVKLFNSPDSASPDETIASPSATWNTGTSPAFYLFGAPAAGTTGFTAWWDRIVANAISYPGPLAGGGGGGSGNQLHAVRHKHGG